jgi:hypothetical protein
VLPVKRALDDIGLPFTVRIHERGRQVDADLTTELIELPNYPGFQGWDAVFDLLERAIGLYQARIDRAVADQTAMRRTIAESIPVSDEALRTRCLPLLVSLNADSVESDEVEKGTKLDMVVREMSVILEDRIRKLAELNDASLAGIALTSRAFGGQNPPLRFSTDVAIQDGAHLLYRGFSGFVRNEVMHRLVPTYAKERVVQLLGLVDYLLFLLTQAKREPHP